MRLNAYLNSGWRKRKMDKIRFIIAGSGWRSLYYARIAKALLEISKLHKTYSKCALTEKTVIGQPPQSIGK